MPSAANITICTERNTVCELFALESLHLLLQDAHGFATSLARRQVHLFIKETTERIATLILEVPLLQDISSCILTLVLGI